jgi:hypothetical protein
MLDQLTISWIFCIYLTSVIICFCTIENVIKKIVLLPNAIKILRVLIFFPVINSIYAFLVIVGWCIGFLKIK